MKKIAIALAVILGAITLTTRAAVIKVGGAEFPTPEFVPDSVRIAAGDTVRWYQLDGEHTSTSGTDSNDPNAGSDYNGIFGSAPTSFDYQFNIPGSYANFCIPHDFLGMRGKIIVTPPVAAHVAAIGEISVSFDTDSVGITTGETVEFYWGTGSHTITSGTGSGDPNAGNMLHAPLDFQTPAVQLTFGAAGVYPFFCVPHELADMRTTVYVFDPCNCPCKYDPSCDGVISDVLDVTGVINVAFRGSASVTDPECPIQRADVDISGNVDVLDVTKVINVAFRGGTIAANYVDPCL